MSTVSSSPCSIQLMRLCSEPWYMKVLFISSILDTSLIYSYENNDLITPSRMAITVSGRDEAFADMGNEQGKHHEYADGHDKGKYHHHTHEHALQLLPKYLIQPRLKLTGLRLLIILKKLQDQVRALMPTTMESIKLKIPLINGSPRNFVLLGDAYVGILFFTSISPSGLRTLQWRNHCRSAS